MIACRIGMTEKVNNLVMYAVVLVGWTRTNSNKILNDGNSEVDVKKKPVN